MSAFLPFTQTAVAYPNIGATSGTVLGPASLGLQTDLVIANQTAYVQLIVPDNTDLGIGGGFHLSDEFALPPQTVSFPGAIGFRARTFVTGSPATILGIVWERGDPLPAGASLFTSTVSGGGGVTPPSSLQTYYNGGASVGSEAGLNFGALISAYGIANTVTDNPGGSRVDLSQSVSLSTLSNLLGANVNMTSANTYVDGPTVTLTGGAGAVWVLGGGVLVKQPSVGRVEAKLWDGTTVYSATELEISGTNVSTPLTLFGIVTLAGATAVLKISAASQVAAAVMLSNLQSNGPGNFASYLYAFRIK